MGFEVGGGRLAVDVAQSVTCGLADGLVRVEHPMRHILEQRRVRGQIGRLERRLERRFAHGRHIRLAYLVLGVSRTREQVLDERRAERRLLLKQRHRLLDRHHAHLRRHVDQSAEEGILE